MRQRDHRPSPSVDWAVEQSTSRQVIASSGDLAADVVVTHLNGVPLHGAVALHGELCWESAPMLEAVLASFDQDGVDDVSFDLARLRLCTSAGVDLWADLAARLESRDGTVVLRNPHRIVRRVLDIAGLPHTDVA